MVSAIIVAPKLPAQHNEIRYLLLLAFKQLSSWFVCGSESDSNDTNFIFEMTYKLHFFSE
jgi:hypothetical protein